jgi:formylglycine-generating enzyme required for sulfatase activity
MTTLVENNQVVLVPAGEFEYGSALSPEKRATDSISLWVDAFYMNQYEVTVSEFADFLEVLQADYKACYYRTCSGFDPNLPIIEKVAQMRTIVRPIQVNWYAAFAYCQWRGGRLPTEIEWEKAKPLSSFNFEGQPTYDLNEMTGDLYRETYPQPVVEPFEPTFLWPGGLTMRRTQDLQWRGSGGLGTFRCVYTLETGGESL